MAENQRTEVSSLGEFGLIDRIAKRFSSFSTNQTLKGIGDDAAVLDLGGPNLTLITNDMLLEGIHFDLRYAPLKHLGFKAVAVNISDIAAMNGRPLSITVGLGLSNRFSVEAIDEMYEGIHLACREYGVDLIGGDTTSSRSGLVISITAIGEVERNSVTYRSGAKPGQVICISADLGAAYMGLQLLEREKQQYLANPEMTPQLENHAYLVERQLKPDARMDLIHELKETGVAPTAMMDISDGLSSELLHLCKQSSVGCAVYAEQIPIANETRLAASEFGLSPLTCALNGGEDYELLMVFSQADFQKVKNLPDIIPIGITREASDGAILVTADNQPIPLTAQGWVSF